MRNSKFCIHKKQLIFCTLPTILKSWLEINFADFSIFKRNLSYMMQKCLFLLLFINIHILTAQKITCSAKDKTLFLDKIKTLKEQYDSTNSTGETVTAVAKSFLGVPYVAKTLEISKKESLVINLHGLDCTTFVENVLVFSQMLRNNKDDFDTFISYLENLRYRQGKLDGYASRLHYFSEWILDNEQKGIIKNITGEIGGTELHKKINFMSTHSDLYPFLSDQQNLEGIKKSESVISTTEICFLPKDNIRENESYIQSGDIIALTTSINGLDITHTGFAFQKQDGHIYLLHASTKGQVMISEKNLVEYLQGIKKNTGIIICRVQ